jgi:pimeloyl-ACP methyl ester carboxylesterase
MAKSFSMRHLYRELSESSPPSFVRDDSLMIWENESGSDKVIFVFGGGGLLAFLMFAELHVSLKEMGCHIVYLLDRHSGFFMKSKRWPTPAILLSELKGVADRLGVKKIYAMGSSSGGYAALRYGADLGAIRVLTFNPLVTPATTSVSTTQRFFKNISEQDAVFIANIDDYYRSNTRQPNVDIVYGAGSDPDRIAAEALAEFESVQLHPLDGCNNHAALTWVNANGDLQPYLDNFLAHPNEN